MRKIVVAALAAVVVLIGFSPAAQAGNGTSNFYLAASCSPAGSNGARLSVTNWDLPPGYGQNYHIDMNSDRTGTAAYDLPKYTSAFVTIDGTSQGTALNDFYRRKTDLGRHLFKGYWKNIYGGYNSCSFYL